MSERAQLCKLVSAIIFTLAGIGLIVGFIVKINQSCSEMCGAFTTQNNLGQCCNPDQLYTNCTVKDVCGSNMVLLVCGIVCILLALWGYCLVFCKEGGSNSQNPFLGIKPVVVEPTEQQIRKANLHHYYEQQRKRKLQQANRGYYFQLRMQGRI